MNKHKLIEDVKNTNYKMHKSKKGWVVSYSLLTLMLGGLFYSNTSLVQNVKAAEIQSPISQRLGHSAHDSHQMADDQEISEAKKNAISSLEVEAAKIRDKIRTDKQLNNLKKQEQLAGVDTMLNQAKDKVETATTLVDIKIITANKILKIDSCYKAVTDTVNVRSRKSAVPLNKRVDKDISIGNIHVASVTKTTITSTYEDKNGNKLEPSEAIKITGTIGEEVAIPKAPKIPDYTFDHVEIDGQEVANDAKITINSKTKVKYVYHALADDQDTGERAIDDVTGKPKQKDNVDQVEPEAKSAGTKLDQAKSQALQALKDEHDKIMGKLGGDRYLIASERYQQLRVLEDVYMNARVQIDQAISADEINQIIRATKTAIDQAYKPSIDVYPAFEEEAAKINADQSANTAKLNQIANTTNGADDNLSNQTGSETNEKVQPPVNDNQPAQPKQTIKTVAASSTSIKWKDRTGKDSNVTLTLTDDNQELDISGGTITDPNLLLTKIGSIEPGIKLKKIKITGNLTITGNASYLFSDLGGLTQIEGLEKLDTSGVTDMNNMFSDCKNLNSLDLSKFDTSKVTRMDSMFWGCNSLTSLDLSHFDTSKVTDVTNMFLDCKNLSSLDVSKFDTSKVTNMGAMFWGCESLTSLDLSHFDTSKVTNMGDMFEECITLNTLKLGSNFNRKNDALSLGGVWYKVGSGTLNNPEEKTGQSGTRFDSSTVSADTYVRLGSVTVLYLDSSNKVIERETCSGLLGGKFSPKQEITDDNGQKYFLTNDEKNSQNVTFTDTDSNDAHSAFYFYYAGVDAAKQAIEEEAQATKKKIQEDQSLTAAEKAQQTKVVDNAVQDAKETIDQATNADGVNTAVTDGKTNIDKAYKPGTSVAEQQSAAKQAIQEEAQATKEKIQEDQSLTAAEKAQQTKVVDNAVQDANDKIDQATNADGVNTAVTDGKTNIDKAYKPGTSVAEQQSAAKQAIQEEAQATKEKIQEDQSLTAAEKAQQTKVVDNAVQDANDKIDQATNADGVNTAVTDGKTNIDKAYKPGTSVAEQQSAAKQAIQEEAQATKEKIQEDQSLTAAEKAQQTKVVDNAVQDANDKIDQATNADGVNTAVTDGKTNIDKAYKPGTSVAEQQSAAKQAIQEEAQATKEKIQEDQSLTAAEKAQQTKVVDNAVQDANDKIDQATNADGVNTAVTDGKTNIDKAYKPGTSVAEQQSAAKQAIQEEAQATKEKIQEDQSLTAAEKAQQTKVVDNAVQDANDKIDQATNADGVNTAVTDGKTNIDKAYKPGTSVAEQQSAAKQAIQEEAQATKEKIQEDQSLTAAEKTQQTKVVDNAVQDAKETIDQATNADGVNTAVTDGKTNIDKAYKPGTSVAEQQSAAKQAIQEEAQATKEKIQEDQSLTAAEKAQQTKVVDNAVQDAKETIDQATNADGVNTAVTDGKTNIDKAYKPGTSVAEQQSAAKQAIQEEAQATKEKIQEDQSLTAAEKAQQTKVVDNAVQDANDKIDQATNADGVNTAVTDGKTNIDKAYKPGTSVAEQQSAAKQAIQEEAQATKEKIQEDQSLTAAEKAQQTKVVDNAVQDANDKIDQATNADGVNTAVTDGKTNIDKAYKPGTSVAEQQSAAKQAIQEEAQATKEKIQEDQSLTAAEKAQQTKVVDAAVQDAKETIDQATNADGVNTAVTDGKTNIDKAYKPGTSVAEQQSAAKQAIQEEAQATKEKIQEDQSLTAAEKAQQTKVVDNAVQDANDKIDQATNADGVNTAVTDGKTNIDKAYKPGTSVAEQQSAAKQAIQEEAQATKEKIQEDQSLTAAEKTQQTKVVDNAVQDAKETIDQATNADGVNTAVTDGKTNIDKAYKPGTSVAEQQSAAKQAIQEEAQATKEKIQEDQSLTAAEKAQQTQVVDNAVQDANDKIDQATNADGVNTAVTDGKTNIDKAYKPGTGIAGGKDNNGNNSNSNNIPLPNAGNGNSSSNSNPGDSKVSEVSPKPIPNAVEKTLKHNAYFYNKEGKRANLLIAKKGSIIATYGTEKINGHDFYLTDNGLYVDVYNVIGQKRNLVHNAFVYNHYGKRISSKLLRKNTAVITYGDPVKIHGKAYYLTVNNHYVKVANFAPSITRPSKQVADGVTANAVIKHNSYVYNDEGKRINQVILKIGSRFTIGQRKVVNGRELLEITPNQYVASGNVIGTKRQLKVASHIYNKDGKRLAGKQLKKHKTIRTYGNAVKIHGKAYYIIGHNQYIKKRSF